MVLVIFIPPVDYVFVFYVISVFGSVDYVFAGNVISSNYISLTLPNGTRLIVTSCTLL